QRCSRRSNLQHESVAIEYLFWKPCRTGVTARGDGVQAARETEAESALVMAAMTPILASTKGLTLHLSSGFRLNDEMKALDENGSRLTVPRQQSDTLWLTEQRFGK